MQTNSKYQFTHQETLSNILTTNDEINIGLSILSSVESSISIDILGNQEQEIYNLSIQHVKMIQETRLEV